MNYVTVKGDTLWDLSKKFLGEGNRWRELGYPDDPTKMPVGVKLNIPEPNTQPDYVADGGNVMSSAVAVNGEPAQLPEGQVPQIENKIIEGEYKPTAQYGQRGSLWKASGGVHRGTDFSAKEGTVVKLPGEGKWKVIENGKGYNSGYGNSVVVQNTETGEKMRFSHLNTSILDVGEEIVGGTPIGLIGSTGNSTAPHIDIEYHDAKGNSIDPRKSKYAKYF